MHERSALMYYEDAEVKRIRENFSNYHFDKIPFYSQKTKDFLNS